MKKRTTLYIDRAAQADIDTILKDMTLPKSLITRPQKIEEIRRLWDDYYTAMIAPIGPGDVDGPITRAEFAELAEKDLCAANAITEAFFGFSLEIKDGHVRAADNRGSGDKIPDIIDIRADAKRFARLEQALDLQAAPNWMLVGIADHIGRTPDAITRMRMSYTCGVMAAALYSMIDVPRKERDAVSEKFRRKYVKKRHLHLPDTHRYLLISSTYRAPRQDAIPARGFAFICIPTQLPPFPFPFLFSFLFLLPQTGPDRTGTPL